ncbi:MAG TPA: DsbA family protein, partial [Gammaproteobacteria bacterium]|nr:DsbA family protein [Gammaproteobacteria bacterium]
MNAVLHYIYDPLCGWCYGAEPLVSAASNVDGLALRMHAGGLWPQPTRLPDQTRRYIAQADARVGQMSGQPYGEPYLNGLLFDPELVLESRPV